MVEVPVRAGQGTRYGGQADDCLAFGGPPGVLAVDLDGERIADGVCGQLLDRGRLIGTAGDGGRAGEGEEGVRGPTGQPGRACDEDPCRILKRLSESAGCRGALGLCQGATARATHSRSSARRRSWSVVGSSAVAV